MTERKLRVGIIGAGMFALWFHAPQLRATGRAEIAAICRRRPKQLAAAQEAFGVDRAYTDWRAMLEREDLDAVLVSTPHHYHVEPALGALARGLHVLVDKPMALTGQEAWGMVDAAARAERVLMVAYGPRAEGVWRSLKRQLDGGIIGRVRQVSCTTTAYRRWFWEGEGIPADVMDLARSILDVPEAFYEGWREWHGDPAQMGGGTFADIGVYDLDRVLWLAGAPATEVTALTDNAGLPVPCFISAQARLANGVLLSLNFADGPPQPLLSGQRQMMFVGDEGVVMDDADGRFWLCKGGERTTLAVDQPDTTIAEAFVSAILDGEPVLSPAYQGANVVDVMEAISRSAAERRIVPITPRPQA